MRARLPKIGKKRGAGRSAPKRSRFVLLIGDEGAILVQLRGATVLSRFFSPAVDAPQMEDFRRALTEAPNAPILVIFDTIDQTYVQQTLPPVSKMSVPKLMKRRLDREFQDDEYLKGSVLMGRERSGRRDWFFMMIALNRTEFVNRWLEVLEMWPNPCRGICLLPVECGHLMKKLPRHTAQAKQKASKKKKTRAEDTADEWHFLVSYNKVSGIRQVIQKRGAVVLTRLGLTPANTEPGAIAGAIEQEILGTVEYLKRLGYADNDPIEISVIAPDDVNQLIDVARLPKVRLMTPHEAATAAGYAHATQPNDRFGDVLLAASIGSLRALKLKMMTSELRLLNGFSKGIKFERALGFLVMLWLLWFSGSTGYEVYTIQRESEEIKQKQAMVEQSFAGLQEKEKQAPAPLDKINEITNLYNRLGNGQAAPMPLLARISAVMPKQVRATDVKVSVNSGDIKAPAAPPPGAPPARPPAPAADAKGPAKPLEMTLKVEFDASIVNNNDTLRRVGEEFLTTMKTALPDYVVAYAAPPGGEATPEKMDIIIGDAPAAPSAPAKPLNLAATLTINGPVTPAKLPGQEVPNAPQ